MVLWTPYGGVAFPVCRSHHHNRTHRSPILTFVCSLNYPFGLSLSLFTTRTNQQSNDLIEHLPSCAFVAIDEEMTGIQIPGSQRPRKDQSPSERYVDDLKKVPERYSIIQLGVALFHYNDTTNGRRGGGRGGDDAPQAWKVRKYNFYMFPEASSDFIGGNGTDTREVVLNPGAVAFLNSHNMSFDTWVKEGIPYATSRERASELLLEYVSTEKRRRDEEQREREAGTGAGPTVQETLRRHVELRRSDDIDFYAQTMASLREWLDAAHTPVVVGHGGGIGQGGNNNNNNNGAAGRNGNGRNETNGNSNNDILNSSNSFLLPACNSFLRRALYENIAKEVSCWYRLERLG